MARFIDPNAKRDSQYSDTANEDIFTLSGYTKVFETCESESDVFACLTKKMPEIDVNVLKQKLRSYQLFSHVEDLFSYWKRRFENLKSVKKNDLKKFIQIFSLLENVFRNTLLRPYIPAYRTINMNCGRYCSSVTTSEEGLFASLKFEHNDPNLLTYKGKDPIQTIVYAITCCVFWQVLSMELPDKRSTSV